jgi:imidazolonepropionase-like amidohydrolase
VTGWLVADSVWWDGRLRTDVGLRLHDGVAAPVPIGEIPRGAARRRLPGTLLPGLCDAHVHSALVDLATVRAGGIASVWDLGGVPDQVRDLAERARRPGSALPRIRLAGPFLTAPGGYPSDRPWAPAGSCRAVRSAADAGDAVAEARAAGATLIKVTMHAGGPVLPRPTLRAVVDTAHSAGLPVVVHAEGPGTVAAAHDAGAEMLAHTPWTEAVDDGLVRSAAARMTWISTLDIHGWGRPTPAQGTAIGNLRRFLEYGGSVRYGTDLGNGPLPPAVNPREIRALQIAGMVPDRVLAAMADPGAAPSWIAGGLDLDPGRFADVLATVRVVGPEVRPRRESSW